MKRRLPKLSSLDTFRVAAAEGSFKAAAELLHLTPSAISHQIRGLEAELGTPLFERQVRKLVLTPAGRDYAAVIDEAFSLLARGTHTLQAQASRQSLGLTMGSFVADEWVLPHLATFTRSHPNIDLRLDTSQRSRDLMREDIDVALRFGVRGRWPGLTAVHLLDVYATPVVSPKLLDGQPATIEVLSRLPRLESTAVPDAWAQWERVMGLKLERPEHTVWMDSYLALLHGASQGLGVALGLCPLINSWLDGQRLVAPWPRTPKPAAGYWFVHRPNEQDDPAVSALLQWLRDTLPTNT